MGGRYQVDPYCQLIEGGWRGASLTFGSLKDDRVRRKFGCVKAAACICSARTFYTCERHCGCVRRMFFAYVEGRKSKDGAKVRQSLPKSGPQVCQSPEQLSQLTAMFFSSCPIENKRLPIRIISEQALKHYLAGKLRFGENDSWSAPLRVFPCPCAG